MHSDSTLRFLDCRLDLDEARLLRGEQVVSLRPKTFAVLAYLAARPGRLVTKQELLSAVWADTAVSDWVLTTSIKELRQAVGDDPPQRRIVETLHRRGYRFVAELREQDSSPPSARAFQPDRSQAGPSSLLVGRERELDELRSCLGRAAEGTRQIVFVAGEPGIGKTTLVDEFLNRIAADDGGILVARGHCVAQHGSGEAYMPVFEAMSALCRSARGNEIVELLERYAPSWLVELSGVLHAEGQSALRSRLPRGTHESTLREAAAFFAQLPFPVVFVLEDLHWSDFGTLELLSSLAARREPAKLLLIATYRPVDVATRAHPLRNVHRELQGRRACSDLWLEHLSIDSIASYLEERWPGLRDCRRHAQVIARRTDGNPLFMVHLLDHIVATGALRRDDGAWTMDDVLSDPSSELPRGLRAMIATSLDRLDPAERSMLQAASVIGQQFRADLLASAMETGIPEIEERLENLAARELLVRRTDESAWPDGSRSRLFELTHALYQQELYRELAAARRTRLHLRVAVRLENAWKERRSEIASELAFHLEAAGDVDRAVEALQAGARRAFALAAHQDGISLLDHALVLLDSAPPSDARTLATMRVCIETGAAASQSVSFGDPRAEAAFLRAHALAKKADDLAQHMQASFGLAGFCIATAQLGRARQVIDELHATAERLPFAGIRFGAQLQEGIWQYHAGSLALAQGRLEAALAIEDFPVAGVTQDLHCMANNYLALALAHLGEVPSSLDQLAKARSRAGSMGNPLDLTQAAMFECFVQAMLEDDAALEEASQRALGLAVQYGASTTASVARLCQGFLRARRGERGALDAVREAIGSYEATNQRTALPFVLGLATQAALELGDLESAGQTVEQTRRLIGHTGERRFAAEAERLDGIVRLRRGDQAEGRALLARSLELARAEGSKLWEKRALRTLEGVG